MVSGLVSRPIFSNVFCEETPAAGSFRQIRTVGIDTHAKLSDLADRYLASRTASCVAESEAFLLVQRHRVIRMALVSEIKVHPIQIPLVS